MHIPNFTQRPDPATAGDIHTQYGPDFLEELVRIGDSHPLDDDLWDLSGADCKRGDFIRWLVQEGRINDEDRTGAALHIANGNSAGHD